MNSKSDPEQQTVEKLFTARSEAEISVFHQFRQKFSNEFDDGANFLRQQSDYPAVTGNK